MFQKNPPSFFKLLMDTLDIFDFISTNSYLTFYQTLKPKRLYLLEGFLSSLILQKIFSIPTNFLLILFLVLCWELRDFYSFSKVPDAPLFSALKPTLNLISNRCSKNGQSHSSDLPPDRFLPC